ncbi:GNAT family N-acetyltransferase [Aquimarina pacifica]|uniref:GNAT family N-acetyltransferase n=1 Tax=Aquimarina pacifica TaxID=1296415 RepID=UPI00046EA861|nr:GNAT family N-acetyltransferase [Aquimarina pacifica]
MKQNYKISIKSLEDSINVAEYKEWLIANSNNSVYYSVEHMRPFDKDFGKLNYFSFEKDNTAIIVMPFIIREISYNNTSSPYYDVISPWGYCGPIMQESVISEDLVEFWEQVDQWYAENNIVTEFVRFSLNGNHQHYSGSIVKTLSNIRGNLFSNFEEQWTAFNPKVRNNYRKAIQYNLDFKIFHNKEITTDLIKIFNYIYVDTMNRNNADSTHFFSDTYFENLILSNLENFSIAVAYYEDIPISVELIISYKQTIYAFLGGTNAEYFSYRPNDFLRVKIIEWAINAQKKNYVLGGGVKDGDGLYRSKKALFPKDEPAIFYTGRKIINQEVHEELCLACNKEKYLNLSKEDFDTHFFPFYRSSK